MNPGEHTPESRLACIDGLEVRPGDLIRLKAKPGAWPSTISAINRITGYLSLRGWGNACVSPYAIQEVVRHQAPSAV